jgi:CheY-like chemotaxis protein
MKRLEAQLRQSQKLESIGTIASGVAHNFRNVLSGISVNTQLLELQNQENARVREAADRIMHSVKRGSALVDDLTQFAREESPARFELFDLVDVLKETVQLIQASFDKKISIHTALPESVLLYGDHSAMCQVFMNLFTNARDAMPEGGDLTIQARVEDAVTIAVSDTGKGMDEMTTEKCFDPFFTTKEVDKGTGLGLSTAYGIIKEHGGDIRVDSNVDEGTSFTITMPKAPFHKRKESRAISEITRGQGERILVVDDEVNILEPLEKLLREVGYRATSESTAQAALEKYPSLKPQVVLVDRNMPEMDGIRCARELLLLDPNARIVLVSGYEEVGIDGIDKGIRERIKGYITKPIDIAELSRVLDGIFSDRKP